MPTPQPEPDGMPPWRPVPRAYQGADTTASRYAQPRAWLRTLTWLINAGLHPTAGPTTVAVANDLAHRMDYQAGTVLYDMAGTARRLSISAATVKRHVAVLRELGALVWLRHGSKKNLRLPGRKYTPTATIYGAAIPPVWDKAMGHRLSGTGYGHRVTGVTDAGRDRAVTAARTTARTTGGTVACPVPETDVCPTAGTAVRPGDRTAVRPSPQSSNQSPGAGISGRAPHSLGSNHPQKVQVDGGVNYTPRKRASRPTASLPTTSTHATNRTSASASATAGTAGRTAHRAGTSRRSPAQVARDITIARHVRPHVAWTQTEGLRRLAYALRPLIDQGLAAHDIAAELHSWYLTWRPAQPAAYITAELRRRAQRAHDTAGCVPPTPAFRATLAQARSTAADVVPAPDAGPDSMPADLEDLTRAEVIDMRSAAASDPSLVIAAIELLGTRDARRLYTSRTVDAVLRFGVAAVT